jgi:hypothetical protein
MSIVFKSKYDLIVVACVSLAAYWIHSAAWPLHPGRDWAAYLSVLELIKDGNLFQKHSLVDLAGSGPVISHFPPVTPLVTGFILFLGGPILLEISLSLAFCFVNFATYTIASLWGRILGIISVIILCLFQPYIHIFHQASSDAIYATLLILFFFLSFRFLNSQNYKTTIFIGLIAFLVYFTRNSGMILFVFWPSILVLLGLFGLKRFIRHALAFSCICAILLSCWATYFFVTVNSFQTYFGSAFFAMVKVHTYDQIFYPENGPASKELSQIIKKNIEEGKYRDVLDLRTGRPLTDFETFRTAGARSHILLVAAPRAQYSIEESNRLIKKAVVEAIWAHPRRYLRGLIRTLHENLFFGRILDYTDETSSYAKAKATVKVKVKKGLTVSASEMMLALSIRDGNQKLRLLLDSYKLPNMYFWTIAGFGLLIGTVGFAEITLIGYLLLSLGHILMVTLAGGNIYQYRAPLDPIFIIIGVVGLSKVFYAIKHHEHDAFCRLYKTIYIAVFLTSLIALPFLIIHESRFPEIFGRYSVSSFVILAFDVLIAAGLILSFVGEKRSSRAYRSSGIDRDRTDLSIYTYKYISAGLVLCFLTIWLPLAYSFLIDNI